MRMSDHLEPVIAGRDERIGSHAPGVGLDPVRVHAVQPVLEADAVGPFETQPGEDKLDLPRAGREPQARRALRQLDERCCGIRVR